MPDTKAGRARLDSINERIAAGVKMYAADDRLHSGILLSKADIAELRREAAQQGVAVGAAQERERIRMRFRAFWRIEDRRPATVQEIDAILAEASDDPRNEFSRAAQLEAEAEDATWD